MAAFKRRAIAPPQDEAAGDAEAQLPLNETALAAQNDGARAAQYMQYVKALNNQFTSWVQQQLLEHPLELWQEGIQDYLRHASSIKDDFKDVLASYTPTNAGAQSKSLSSSQNTGTQSTSLFGSQHLNEDLSTRAFGKSELRSGTLVSQSFPSLVLPPSVKTPPPGESFLNIPAHGVPSLIRPPNNGSDIHDTQEDDDAVQEPSSPSVKRSEEPGVKIVHEIKCKLYIKGDTTTDGAWKEMGMGNLTLRVREGAEKGTKEAKATVLVRNEVGRVLLNALLYPNIKMKIQKNTVTGIFHSAEADVKIQGVGSPETASVKGRLYLFRLKTPSDAEQLVEVLTSNAPKGD